MRFGDPWTEAQHTLVDVVVEAWVRFSQWPNLEYVATRLEDDGLDAVEVLRSFPVLGERGPLSRSYCDVRFEHTLPRPRDDSEVALTVAGLARHPLGSELAQLFIAVLRLAAERRKDAPRDPTKIVEVVLTSQEMAERLPQWPAELLAHVVPLLHSEWPPGVQSWESAPDTGTWSLKAGREATRYLGLTVERYLDLIRRDVEGQSRAASGGEPIGSGGSYVASSWPTPASVQGMNPARAIEELRRLKEAADGSDVQRAGPVHDEWKTKVQIVMQRALGRDATVLESFEQVSYYIGVYTGDPGEAEQDRLHFAEALKTAVAYIDAAIYELELDLDPETTTAAPPTGSPSTPATIFIVHGHDDGLKEAVARLLERVTDLGIVILHEQPDSGRTIIEKFEAHAELAVFAIVLLTPDDEVRVTANASAKPTYRPRARQNVILELGYFIGRLGRSRVVALHKGDVELPSDMAGILYKKVDDAGAWRFAVASELRAAGIEVDLNAL